MGTASYRIKVGLYVFFIIMVGILFMVRVYNTWQRINYSTETVLRHGEVQISLHYPIQILSAKSDASYPLTISFYYTGDTTSLHTYEISLQSPTLLFVDAKGSEVTPHFQFTSDHAFLERSVYIRPYLSGSYPPHHAIDIQVSVDGQEAQNLPAPIEIETESWLFSFFSLAAASFLEISILAALVTWIVNTIDTAWNARKELISQRRNDLNSLASLPYLERLNAFIALEDQVRRDHVENDLIGELQQMQRLFANSEREFMQAVGEQLRQEG